MKIAIVDDDAMFRKELYELLHSKFHENDIDMFEDGVIFLDQYKHYDLVLLDIEMPNLSGLEVKDRIISNHTFIIFITAHGDVMKQAFGFNIMGFVGKDKINNELFPLIEKTAKKIAQLKQYIFKVDGGYESINESDILYFEAFQRRIIVHTLYKDIEIFGEKLKDFEKNIMFYRINRSEIINLIYVGSIKKNILKLKHRNDCLEVSRGRLKNLKIRYMNMVFEI